MNKKLWQIGIGAAVVVLAVAGFVWYSNPAQAPVQTGGAQEQQGHITLSVQGLYQNKELPVVANESVLKVLEDVNAQDAQLQLTTKEYSGLGTLVTGMHGVVNGSGKEYWQYKVNGVMPQIGADAYKLKNGDSIEWFFAASSE